MLGFIRDFRSLLLLLWYHSTWFTILGWIDNVHGERGNIIALNTHAVCDGYECCIMITS